MVAKILIFAIIMGVSSNTIIDGNAQMVKDNEIIEPVIVHIEGEIGEAAAQRFAIDMKAAEETGQPFIPVVIRSYGGSIYSMMSMIDVINKAKGRIPVATIVIGKAMSAGAAMLTCGTEGMRYAAPHSTIMIHEASSLVRGKVGDVSSDTEELKRLNTLMLSIMAHNIGKDPDYFTKIIHTRGHADWYLTPEQAKTHNIVNHIGIPDINFNIKVELTLDLPNKE